MATSAPNTQPPTRPGDGFVLGSTASSQDGSVYCLPLPQRHYDDGYCRGYIAGIRETHIGPMRHKSEECCYTPEHAFNRFLLGLFAGALGGLLLGLFIGLFLAYKH